MHLQRRTALGTLSAAALAAVGPAAAAVMTSKVLDPVRDAALINIKLRYRADNGPLFWWMKGTKLGQVNAAMRPLFDMQVGTIARIAHKPDGTFDLTSLEVVFYTDLETGARLRQWKNPYTEATVNVTHGPLGPETIAFKADARKVEVPREVGGAIIAGKFDSQASVVGDDVWAQTQSTVSVTQKDAAVPPFQVNEWSTFHGRAADVLAANKPFIPATSHLQESTSWSKWMGMADRPGNLTARCIGAKVKTYAEMPEKWRSLMAEAHPDIAADPIGALDRPAARLDR